MGLFLMETDHSRDGGGGIVMGILGAFCLLCSLGALLNVWVCGRDARREAAAAPVLEEPAPGLSPAEL